MDGTATKKNFFEKRFLWPWPTFKVTHCRSHLSPRYGKYVPLLRWLQLCSFGSYRAHKKILLMTYFGCKSRSSGDLFFWHTRFCKDPPGEFTGKVKWSVRAINVTKVWMAPPQKSQFSKNGSCDLDLLSRSPIVELIRAPFMVNMLH